MSSSCCLLNIPGGLSLGRYRQIDLMAAHEGMQQRMHLLQRFDSPVCYRGLCYGLEIAYEQLQQVASSTGGDSCYCTHPSCWLCSRHISTPAVRTCHAIKSPNQAPSSTIPQLKEQIIKRAGNRYGHNLDDKARASVEEVVKQLEAVAPAPAASAEKLAGSSWVLVYTTSTGTSSGKVGPFITDVEQVRLLHATTYCFPY